jgi:hypothetical protein
MHFIVWGLHPVAHFYAVTPKLCLPHFGGEFRGSKFPGNMHNYIWCSYYLHVPSFMKFCSVVSEELRWQTVWRTDGQDKNTSVNDAVQTNKNDK